MKHYNFLFLMADQIRTATLEGMAVYPCILHLPALHAQPGITGNGALSQPLRRAHP